MVNEPDRQGTNECVDPNAKADDGAHFGSAQEALPNPSVLLRQYQNNFFEPFVPFCGYSIDGNAPKSSFSAFAFSLI